MMDAPTYRRELHLLVCASDAIWPRFASSGGDDVNRVGLLSRWAHPDHQRKGLSTAMMREGLRRLQ